MPTRLANVAKNGIPDAKNNNTGIYGKYRELLRDSPWRWLIIAGTVLYLLSPIDLIPDFIPVFGFIDDGVVAAILVHEVVSMVMDGIAKRKADNKNKKETQPLLHGKSHQSNAVEGASMYCPPGQQQGMSMYAPPAHEDITVNLTS